MAAAASSSSAIVRTARDSARRCKVRQEGTRSWPTRKTALRGRRTSSARTARSRCRPATGGSSCWPSAAAVAAAASSGGGGGAGGVLIVSNLFVNAGTYPIEIGAGGPPHNGSNFASNGCPTRAFGFTVPGGGFSRYSTGQSLDAMAGASGGGGAYVSNPAWKNTPGVNQYGQALPGYERDYLRGGRAYLGWGHDGGVGQLRIPGATAMRAAAAARASRGIPGAMRSRRGTAATA
ncbi:MAG: glycine-rich domain-containing protein [Kiritimatiellia bacterium]